MSLETPSSRSWWPKLPSWKLCKVLVVYSYIWLWLHLIAFSKYLCQRFCKIWSTILWLFFVQPLGLKTGDPVNTSSYQVAGPEQVHLNVNLVFQKFFLADLFNLPKYRYLNYLCLTIETIQNHQCLTIWTFHVTHVQDLDTFKQVIFTNMTFMGQGQLDKLGK